MPKDRSSRLEPDVSELLLNQDERLMCESYIFEPGSGEKALGRLYIVGETEARGGIGKELFEMITQALQREYYREPSRGILASFESALHQANLVLHDAAEQGIRDWMGYFHALVAVLAGSQLHISAAGDAAAYLVRHNKATLISSDLAYSPITNPLRTFSQVASGSVTARDVLYIGTPGLAELSQPEHLASFAIEHAAATIATRLQQLYMDTNSSRAMAALVISLLPRHVSIASRPTPAAAPVGRRRDTALPLAPRRPITIHRSVMHALAAIAFKAAMSFGRWLKAKAWPSIIKGSRHSGRILAKFSAVTGRNVKSLAKRWPSKNDDIAAPIIAQTKRFKMPEVKSLPRRLASLARSIVTTMPGTSKVFAALALVLAIILVASLFLLRSQRIEDARIERASEILHDAQNKVASAENALIYNNRDQAQNFISEAINKAAELKSSNLYQPERADLEKKIASVNDRLQKVRRASSNAVKVVGDMSAHFSAESPTQLSFVNGALYTFNPKTNQIVKMDLNGTSSIASDKTIDIGFLKLATPQPADKSIIFATDTPGIAIFDAVANTLSNQQITVPGEKPAITALAAFGSRLYVYDSNQGKIFAFSKNLRGYSGGSSWLTDDKFPAKNIKSLAVDGSIFTLHSDGAVRELYKGQPQEFSLEKVAPDLSSAAKLITSETMRNLYVFDPPNKRVAIYDKKGRLLEQVVLDTAQHLSDVTINPDETVLYALNDTQILSLPLAPR